MPGRSWQWTIGLASLPCSQVRNRSLSSIASRTATWNLLLLMICCQAGPDPHFEGLHSSSMAKARVLAACLIPDNLGSMHCKLISQSEHHPGNASVSNGSQDEGCTRHLACISQLIAGINSNHAGCPVSNKELLEFCRTFAEQSRHPMLISKAACFLA